MKKCSRHRCATRSVSRLLLVTSMCLLLCSIDVTAARGEDWPTYRHDNRLSGVTVEVPKLPLTLAWERLAKVAPTPAWSGPAPWDAFSSNKGLQPQRDFDPAFYTTYADGLLYVGSSVDNVVQAIDPASGKTQWTFFAEGAVRLPPTINRGKAYFGSDDGYVYCVDAKKGTLVWRLRGGPTNTRFPCDGKLISMWPCRTGVLINDGQAYCAFSLMPWKESQLYSLDANDGSVTQRKVMTGKTFQGPMAADSHLVVMQGKGPPVTFDLSEINPAKTYGAGSGVRCALTGDGHLIVGPAGQKKPTNLVMVLDHKSGKPLAGFPGADRMLVDAAMGYVHRNGRLGAFDFEQKKEVALEQAEVDTEAPREIIKAGPILFIGTSGAVTAVDATSGRSVWTADVKGHACGLSFAGGRLFVSTDLGHIYVFAPKPAGK